MDFVRSEGLGCAWGMRRVARRYGLDVSEFLRNGIDEDKLVATGDAQLLYIVETAHAKNREETNP